MVCSSNRAVDRAAPAPPLRSRGTLVTIAQLFGEPKNPKPKPRAGERGKNTVFIC
jgi:hypothetical protein